MSQYSGNSFDSGRFVPMQQMQSNIGPRPQMFQQQQMMQPPPMPQLLSNNDYLSDDFENDIPNNNRRGQPMPMMNNNDSFEIQEQLNHSGLCSMENEDSEFNETESEDSSRVYLKKKVPLPKSDRSDGQTKRKHEKVRSIPSKGSKAYLQDFEEAQLKAYERYVLAQFGDPATVEKERKAAIESLIPGTKFYFHLYFLDLAKKKRKIEDFSPEEKKLWEKFDEKFGTTIQFYEAETVFKVINRIEDQLPKDVGSQTTEKDIDNISEVVEYLRKYYLGSDYNNLFSKPEYLDPTLDHSSSQSGEDDSRLDKPVSDISKVPGSGFETREQRVQRKQQYLKFIKEDTTYFSTDMVAGFEEDLDWSVVKQPKLIFDYARQLIQQSGHLDVNSLEFFQISNPSFFERIAAHFAKQYKEARKIRQEMKAPMMNTRSHTPKEVEIEDHELYESPSSFFEGFTIEQLDLFKAQLQKQGHTIKEANFASAYFSKIFSEELSQEYQESLSVQEKFANLEKLYAFATNSQLSDALLQTLLHEMLILTIKLDDFREDLFKEYLKNPLESNYNLKHRVRSGKRPIAVQIQIKWQECLTNVKTQQKEVFHTSAWDKDRTSSELIPKYLEHLCMYKYQGSLAAYKDYFEKQYLKGIEKKIQVFLTEKGLLDMAGEISPQEFKAIQDKVMIRFKETNKDQFEIDEEVVLKLEVKNVPELKIKVFEFNTETYYKKNLKPFDTTINLQGVLPTIMWTDADGLRDVPKNKVVQKEIKVGQLTGKVGLFIVEIQGNGKESRAIVKKGQLSLIQRSTPAGIIAYVLDKQKVICKGKDTGVWMHNKLYPADPESGRIFMPFGLRQEPTSVVMIHDGFAQLGQFQRKTEDYHFSAYVHLVSESVLIGLDSKLVIRPKLTINNRKASVTHLEDIEVVLNYKDYIQDIETTKTIRDLKFSDSEETIVPIKIPVNVSKIRATVKAAIKKVTSKEKQTFSPISKTFQIYEHSSDCKTQELYLRRTGGEYFIYCLGKNGEAVVNQKMKVQRHHKDFSSAQNDDLITDKEGKVLLRDLKGVYKVKAALSNSNTWEQWSVSGAKADLWTQPTDIHIVQGELISFPVNFHGGKLLPKEASLKMVNSNGLILRNLTSRIQIVPEGNYHLLNLEGLDVGQYELKLNLSAAQIFKVAITVHQGDYWEGNFIIKKNNILESSAPKNAIRFEDVKGSASKLKIQLSNFSESSRVHIMAMQFLPNSPASLLKEMLEYATDSIKFTDLPLAKWKNIFISDDVIGDEMRYVFDRKNRESQLGNNLPQPTLLMKQLKTRDTYVEDENLQSGTKHVLPEKEKAALGDKTVRARTTALVQGKHGFDDGGDNKIKEYQNFLSVAPLQIYNLKPDLETGLVTVDLKGIDNYNQIFIVACDKDSVVQRQLDVAQLGIEAKPIPTKDLTVTPSSKANAGFIDTRETEVLRTGVLANIPDIESSKVQIIDSLIQVYSIVQNMGQKSLNRLFRHSSDGHMSHLYVPLFLKWEELTEEEKTERFCEETCHELNFFIFKKDRPFFDKAVRPFIENKLRKSFVDVYLLSAAGSQYYIDQLLMHLNCPVELAQLSGFEMVLLLEIALTKGRHHQQEKAKALAKRVVAEYRNEQKSESYFSDRNTRDKVFDLVMSQCESDLLETIEKIKAQIRATSQMKVKKGFNNRGYDNYNAIDSKKLVPLGKRTVKQKVMKQAIQQQVDSDTEESCCSSVEEDVMSACMQRMASSPRSRCESIRSNSMCSMVSQEIQEVRNERRRSIVANDYSNNNYSPKRPAKFKMIQKNDIFSNSKNAITEQRGQLLLKSASSGFKGLDSTAEYKETHYFGQVEKVKDRDFYCMNALYANYIEHLMAGKDPAQFLSASFMDISIRFIPMAFALLDLPFSASSAHKHESDGKRGINITAASNSILLRKEIKEGKCELKNDVMIIHRYQQYPSGSEDEQVTEMLVNKPYSCEIVMTNVTPKTKEVNLLFQIPFGSLPMLKTKFINSKQFTIRPFTAERQIIHFYFPSAGDFTHAPSNVSEFQLITCKSTETQLKVRSKRVITKAITFPDIMLTTPTLAKKKEVILDLLKNRDGVLFHDPKFRFYLGDVLYFAQEDSLFFLEVAKIFEKQMIFKKEFAKIIFRHFRYLMKSQAPDRYLLIRILKSALKHLSTERDTLREYVWRPLKSILFNVDPAQLFDQQHEHLEYFPMVNKRAFSVGLQEASSSQGYKKIANFQLRETYSQLIYLLSQQHKQGPRETEVPQRQQLSIAYYLLIQGRLKEATAVFRNVDLASLQNGSGSQTAQIGYDYMKCFFEFQDEASMRDSQKVAAIRAIVDKHKDCPYEQFARIFKALREQLEEIEGQLSNHQIPGYVSDDEEEETEQKPKKILAAKENADPVVHSIETEKKTGKLTIKLVGVKSLKVKYYLIDAEILFSRQPFLKDEAKQFSYVKPFHVVDQAVAEGAEEVYVAMPAELKGKNTVIEVTSEDSQHFTTFYSSDLKLKVRPNDGDLRVFRRDTKQALPKAYVKVYAKNFSGESFFYRDGFTDIRGMFAYSSASGESISSVSKFAVLVSHAELGQEIEIVDAPKQES